MTKSLLQQLSERGFIDHLSSDELSAHLESPRKVYVGFDPTADSLHLGNLIGIMALAHFQRAGHTPVIVLGGTTGRIGDPSGKDQERPLLDEGTIQKNVQGIRRHFEQILDFSGKTPKPQLLNNDEWYQDFSMIDFLRDVGKHFRIGPMLAKESVRTRLQSEEGMSFTEFSYQLIQGYDFYHLFTNQGVTLQMGGSDQWGNITAGIEITRKLAQKSVYGLVWPLLTRSDGKKFGKSESGAIWLSAEKTSPYQFYQYFFRVPDADVIHMLKMLTFLGVEEIKGIEREMSQEGYPPNQAQKRLAEEVTRLIHGESGLETALKVTTSAAPGKETELDVATLQSLAKELPCISLSGEEAEGLRYADLAVQAGLLSSKGEANRLLKNGGAYLNNKKVTDPAFTLSKNDFVEGRFVLLGAGKKKKALITID